MSELKINNIYKGDSLEILKTFPSKCDIDQTIQKLMVLTMNGISFRLSKSMIIFVSRG